MSQRSRLASELAPFDLAELDADKASICAVDDALRIRFVNRAWEAFALENDPHGAPESRSVGASMLDAISEELRPFYAALFARARTEAGLVSHEYECSTPARYRRYQMRILPCRSDLLLVVHSLLVDEAHEPGHAPLEARYRAEHGFVVMCGHCRRTRRADAASAAGTDGWEWVPAYVQQIPPNTSHGLCSVCVQYYFPA